MPKPSKQVSKPSRETVPTTKEQKEIANLLRELRFLQIGLDCLKDQVTKVITEAERKGFKLEELDANTKVKTEDTKPAKRVHDDIEECS